MSPTDAAEIALTALIACQQDAAAVEAAAFDCASARFPDAGFYEAMLTRHMAINMQKAIKAKIATIQPLIAAAIAEREKADRADGFAVTH